jgi:hypothetical protein
MLSFVLGPISDPKLCRDLHNDRIFYSVYNAMRLKFAHATTKLRVPPDRAAPGSGDGKACFACW